MLRKLKNMKGVIMKTWLVTLLGLSTVLVFCTSLTAGSISGNITYTGSATGTLGVAAFPDTLFDGEPSALFESDSVASYSLTGLADGTYYIVAIITHSINNVQETDPYGFYTVAGEKAPVIISGNNSVNNIDITLVDGTHEHPNPFYTSYTGPTEILQLPSTTNSGVDPALAYNGTSFYLYKHDYSGAEGAKIFAINPSDGSVTATHILNLSSMTNDISWIDDILFVNGTLWGIGGYGDPSGSGNYIEGMFQINMASSTSSNQLPLDTSMTFATGLASDGTNFYVAVDSVTQHGVIKFDPTTVSKLPMTYFVKLRTNPESLCYADGYLWVGVDDSLQKIDPINGDFLGSYDVPSRAAGVFVDSLFWMYDQSDNTLKGYSINTVGIQNNPNISQPTNFVLLQNYPNPFNPTTTIRYQLPQDSPVNLIIYDLKGREVWNYSQAQQTAGWHQVQWNGQNRLGELISTGVYFYRLQAGNFVDVKKMVFMK